MKGLLDGTAHESLKARKRWRAGNSGQFICFSTQKFSISPRPRVELGFVVAGFKQERKSFRHAKFRQSNVGNELTCQQHRYFLRHIGCALLFSEAGVVDCLSIILRKKRFLRYWRDTRARSRNWVVKAHEMKFETSKRCSINRDFPTLIGAIASSMFTYSHKRFYLFIKGRISE